MLIRNTGARTADAKLLAMADRLFNDYEDLPVRTVFQAIGSARTELRDRRLGVPTAEEIELLARRRLDAIHTGASPTTPLTR